MNPKKERTYLIVLSLIIISNEFVNINFDKINILGNEASVPEGTISFLIITIWLYFVWCFVQNYGFNIRLNKDSDVYKNALDILSKVYINIKAKKEGHDLTKITPKKLSEADTTKSGVHIHFANSDGMGGIKDDEAPLFIKKYKLLPFRVLAYFYFIIREKEFRVKLFPYIIIIIVIFLFTIDFLSWYLNS